jgi:hypothetical protein
VALSVAVEHIDPRKPIHAATAAVSGTFEQLAPTRGLLLGVAGWGDGPAVAVAPWVLEGIRRAATQHGLTIEAVDLGPTETHGGQRRRLTAAGIPLAHGEGRPLKLELAGSRRPRRIPKAWFGQHLCLVVPCAHTRKSRRKDDGWTGPVEAAFAALDRACRPAGQSVDTAATGARLAAAAFASTTVVLDGTWWAPLSPGDTAPPNVISLDRCFALSSGFPSEAWNRRALSEVDDWLAAQLQLRTGGAGRRHLEVESRGSAARAPWPRAPKLGSAPSRGLAGQALEALWTRRPRQPPGRRALSASVPGPMARFWNDYSGAGLR